MANNKTALKKVLAQVKQQEADLKIKAEKSSFGKLALIVNNTVSNCIYLPLWRMTATESQIQTAIEDAQLNIELLKSKVGTGR